MLPLRDASQGVGLLLVVIKAVIVMVMIRAILLVRAITIPSHCTGPA